MIVVNLDAMLALRKKRSKALATYAGITGQNIALLKSGRVRGVRFNTLVKIVNFCSVRRMLFLSACSQQRMCQAVQEYRLIACEKRVGELRERCIEQHNMAYQEYQRERKALREVK